MTAIPPRAESRILRRTRLRLALWSGGTTLIVLLILGVVVYGFVERQLAADSEEQLRARATLVAALKDPATDPAQIEALKLVSSAEKAGVLFGGPLSGTIAVVDRESGTKVDKFERKGEVAGKLDPVVTAKAKSGDEAKDLEKAAVSAAIAPPRSIDQVINETLAQTGLRADGSEVSLKEMDGVPTRIVSVPAGSPSAAFVVHAFADRTIELRTLSNLAFAMLVGGLLVAVAATLAGWAYSGRALVPIRASLQRQREFAADASHELRTPLSVLRNDLEILARQPQAEPVDREVLADVTDETKRMARLVDDLLLLARTDADSAPIERTDTDLAEAVFEAVDRLTREADSRAVRVEVDAGPAPLRGDPDRLRQLVAILVDNAIKHGREGGHVWVTVRSTNTGARLEIADDGPGVPPEHRERLFERFWRGPDVRAPGSGLGLAIAQWIVAAHAGDISVDERPGGGMRVEVSLPR